MAGSRKGLVAPQNTFFESLLRRFNTPHTGLVIANSRIVDYPVIYVSESFTRLTNYTPPEILRQGAVCKQLHGERTSTNAVERIQRALDSGQLEQVEITLYKKNRSMLWVIMSVAPVLNDLGEIRLYLIVLHDISPLRQPVDDDLLRGSFSKFAKLARSVARNKALMGQVELDDPVSTIAPLQPSSIPKYRQESPRTPPHVLLHYLTFKVAWDWMIFLLTGYTAIVVPYSLAFGTEHDYNDSILTIVDRTVDTVYLVDIILNFHTTFVGPTGAVISDPVLIRLNYLRGWFLVDLISCLPYGVLSDVVPNCSKNIINLFNALRVVRLLRLWRVLRKLDQYLEYVATILLIMVSCLILLAHWLACVWYAVGLHDIQQKEYHGWMPNLAKDIASSEGYNLTEGVTPSMPNKLMLYVTSLYFTVSLITSVGFGNVAANTTTEKVVSVFFMLIGALVYATIFGNVTTILQQTHATRARLQQLMVNVKDFLRIHNVPKGLSERVVDYVTSTWSVTRGVDTDTVLNNCPKDMKADLCVHLYRAVFTEHPAFRLASESCLRALAVAFTAQHNAPGDLIFHQGESIDQLCFVISGSLEVVQDDEVVAILGKGDVFGQPVDLDSDIGQSSATVRALTYCDLHCIKRDSLVNVLRFYSAFANLFTRSLTLTYNLRNRVVFRKLSDVRREQELNEMRRHEPPLSSLAPDHPVRRLISRFCNAATAGAAARRSSSTTIPLSRSESTSSATVQQRKSVSVMRENYAGSGIQIANSAALAESVVDDDRKTTERKTGDKVTTSVPIIIETGVAQSTTPATSIEYDAGYKEEQHVCSEESYTSFDKWDKDFSSQVLDQMEQMRINFKHKVGILSRQIEGIESRIDKLVSSSGGDLSSTCG